MEVDYYYTLTDAKKLAIPAELHTSIIPFSPLSVLD